MKQEKRRIRIAMVAAGSVGALLLAACAPGQPSNEGSQEEGSQSITFSTTGGSLEEAYKEAIVDPFTEETGIGVQLVSPNDPVRVQLMAETGNVEWDVVTSDPAFSTMYCDEYVEKLDFDIIDVSETDPDLVSDCTVPFIVPAQFIVYNTDKYGDNPPTGWEDFFDTEKFPGSRGVPDMMAGGVFEAGMGGSGAKGDEAATIDIDVALAQYDRIKDDLVFWSTSAEMQEAFENGRIDMALGFMNRAWTAMDQGAPYDIVWNEAIYYYDNLMVVKGTKNRDAAMEFINFALQREPSERLTEISVYPTGNIMAEPNLTGSMEKFIPQNRETGIVRNYDWWGENLDEATQAWTNWKVS